MWMTHMATKYCMRERESEEARTLCGMMALKLAACFHVCIAHSHVFITHSHVEGAYGNEILSTALKLASCFNRLITHCHVYEALGNEIL